MVSNANPQTFSSAIAVACRDASLLAREVLLGIAVARGCRHYAAFVPSTYLNYHLNRHDIPHEVLGCALLGGCPDLETFRSIRVGAMVISDLGNDPHAIAAAADECSVTQRLAHICRVALKTDEQPGFWGAMLAALRVADDTSESQFLPGASRFCIETRKKSRVQAISRVWLRTAYSR